MREGAAESPCPGGALGYRGCMAGSTEAEGRGWKLRIPAPWGWVAGLLELFVIVALAIGLALGIQAWLFKPYEIPSQSMEPTLEVGQRVLVTRFLYHFVDPKPGDIVVFHPPAGADRGAQCGAVAGPQQACSRPTVERSDENFIKRIVAGPGDTLSVRDGHPVVNGVIKADEPYAKPCGASSSCNLTKPIVIPPDHYFVMGDNRGGSQDSRFWGPVPRKWIIGKAFVTFWPLDRFAIF